MTGRDDGQAPEHAESVRRTMAALEEAARGSGAAPEALLALVYDELRALANRYLAQERRDHTLQPTALVHEAFLRLVDQTQVVWQNQAHFFSAAATMMRRVLVDHARHHKAQKRGGPDAQRVTLTGVDPGGAAEATLTLDELLSLDDALNELETLDPTQRQLAELRLFAGLPMDEVARVLELSLRTAEREWRMARAWLTQRLQSEHL